MTNNETNYRGIYVLDKILVILMAFVMQAVFAGVLFSFAEYFNLLVIKFNVSYAYIGFIGTSVGGFSNFVSPFSGWLLTKFSYGVIVSTNGILLALSFYLTSYDKYYWQLVLTYSFLFGLSGGILNHLSISCLHDQMNSKEEMALALSISNIGTGVGIICVSTYAAYYTNVNDFLTVDQMLRYMSFLGLLVTTVGIIVFSIVSDKRYNHLSNDSNGSAIIITEESPLFSDRSPRVNKKSENIETDDSTKFHNSRNKLDLNIISDDNNIENKLVLSKFGWELIFSYEGIKNKATLLFISQVIGFPMTIIPFKFAIIYGTQNISDINMYYYIPLVIGFGTVLARFIFNRIASSKNISSFMVNKFLQIGTCISSICLAYINSYNQTEVLLGLFFYSLFNSHFTLVKLRTVELLGDFQHHVNFGIQCFAVGLGYVIGGYIGGSIYDVTSSMKILFLFCSLSFLIAFLYDEIIFYNKSIIKLLVNYFNEEIKNNEEIDPLL